MKKIISICLLLCSFILQAKPTELILWHGLAGHLGDEVRSLAEQFNRSQKDYVVKPIYKGNYVELLTSFAAAFRAHKAPAIVQIYEVGTAMMLSPKGIIKPVETMMHEQKMSLPQQDFITSIKEYYSYNGELMAMPFNLSAPVLYYNQDALAAVGYNSSNFPKTWDGFEILAKKLIDSGYECAYTTAYPGWVLFESYMAIHGLPIISLNPLKAAFNTPGLVHHFERLKRWHELHYFRYAGRVDDGTILFTSKVCPLLSQSSGSYNSLSALVPFKLGVASMPLDTSVSPVRHANVAGGAALWAVGGQSDDNYKGIATFFSFIASPDMQKQWHTHTGYLPIGTRGVYASIAAESKHPNLALAKIDLEEGILTKPLNQYAPQNQIRSITDEALESMFANLMSPQKALADAESRANRELVRFSRNTK